jgi:hypothetical protein
VTGSSYQDLGPVQEEYEKEAKLEGFNSVEGWLEYYPAHNIKIEDTWRVLAKRVI